MRTRRVAGVLGRIFFGATLALGALPAGASSRHETDRTLPVSPSRRR
jgi:hypothetical protein